MNAIVLIDNPQVTLCYEPQRRRLHHTMHAYVSEKNFRELLDAVAAGAAKYGAAQWLCDDREGGTVSLQQHGRAMAELTPQVQASGVRHVAVALPRDALSRWALLQAGQDNASRELQFHLCEDIDEAIAWLDSQAPATVKA